MRHLETQPLSGFNDTNIDEPTSFEVLVDGRKLTYDELISNTPAVTSAYDGYAQPRLTLMDRRGLTAWDEDAHYPVGRLSTIHGRNLEVLADKVRVQDKYGNKFGSVCLKGADMSNPHFIESATAQRDFAVHGLQESLTLERIIRASQLFREHGIGTEYIMGLTQPLSYPLDLGKWAEGCEDGDYTMPVELHELLDFLATEYAARVHEDEGASLAKIRSDMIERFHDCDYLITYRGMDCPYRLGEIIDPEIFEEFKQFLMSKATNKKEYRASKTLERDSHIVNMIADNLGRNTGKIRKLKMRHGFLHLNNITAMGSVVDLDSCKGPALGLGDPENTEKDYINDIFSCIAGIEQFISSLDKECDSQMERCELMNSVYWSTVMYLHRYAEHAFDTTGERLKFFANLLVEANAVDSHLKDTMRYYSFVDSRKRAQLSREILFAAIMSQDKSYSAEDAALLQPELLEISAPVFETRHSQSFLYTLPPIFYIDMKERLLDDKWNMNHLLGEDDQYNEEGGNLKHNLHWSLEALYLEILTAKYRGENAEDINDPEAFLFTLRCGLGMQSAPIDRLNQAVASVHSTYKQQQAKLIDHFSAKRSYRMAEQPADDARYPLNEYLGVSRFTTDGKGWVAVAYMPTEETYADMLEHYASLGVSFKYGGQEDIERMQQDCQNLLFIVDYSHIDELSQCFSNTNMNTVLFQGIGEAEVKPFLVYDYSQPEPTVYVFGRIDMQPGDYPFELLMHKLCPSSYPDPSTKELRDSRGYLYSGSLVSAAS